MSITTGNCPWPQEGKTLYNFYKVAEKNKRMKVVLNFLIINGLMVEKTLRIKEGHNNEGRSKENKLHTNKIVIKIIHSVALIGTKP